MSGEGIAFVSLMESQDSKAGAVNAERIGDLRERAQIIAQRTGAAPMTWQEFQQRVPVEKPSYMRNMLIESAKWAVIVGVIGAVVAAAFATPVLAGAGMFALAGAMLGATAGLYKETTTIKRGEQMGKYETYLSQVEQSAARGPAQSPEIGYRTDHAERLRDSQPGQFIVR